MNIETPKGPRPSAASALSTNRSLRLTPLRQASRLAFPLTHPYFELVYGPLLGPTAVVVARNIGRRLMGRTDPLDVCGATLALEVGLRAKSEHPLGRRSAVRRAIDRLEHQRIVRWLGEYDLGIFTEVPALGARSLSKLPASARSAHEHFTDVIDLAD